ncbi:type VII secretion-associated serine protease mycosin [Nocardia australiensis]|uniref:type VII secretion-associated serine protease mycosin n=1 Tax=Nocardia australiensis TaxID=2887191 RepID=UPI001D15C1C6|nr:type VII secretion-associated serine protease mycosin [Nocardia australiensis]
MTARALIGLPKSVSVPGWRCWAGIACTAAILGVSAFGGSARAGAVPPPSIDPGALGIAQALSGVAAPPEPTEQAQVCTEPMNSHGAPVDSPLAQRVLDLPAAWQFSRGAGQKVAVIDTGVNPHPRLPALRPGGDYVSDSDGTKDCDAHGTLVAGIIAARPSPDDAFAGVAPDAEILTIRQYSLAYQAKERSGDKAPGTLASTGYGNVLTMAAAVVRAVDMGATVINISEVSCTSAGGDTADATLGAAVKYAYDHNVVVVAAAGNVTRDGGCDKQNDNPGWSSVQTVASPAWFHPYVLSVASIDPDGMPSQISLHGPWVGAAAIGRSIVSLDSRPGGTGLVDSQQYQDGPGPIDGTSFATPYVSGLAALIRARFPELTAGQVIDRITRTAQAPGSGRDDAIGHGLIDPVAALTAELPDRPVSEGGAVPRPIAAPVHPPGPDPLPRRVAVIGSITCLVVLGLGAAVSVPFRRRRADADLDSPATEV